MKPRQRGFTLIELAIVMLVLTILAAGLLVPLASSIEMKRIATTQNILEDAKEALIGYAMSHRATDGRPYLPCPDKMTTPNATNTPNDGKEDRTATGECEFREGNFPWTTLGTGNADAWGNRLRYRVTLVYARSSNGFYSAPTPPAADIQICGQAGCPAGSLIATQVPAVILSMGKNGWGAMNSNATNGVAQAAPTSADELENVNGGADFVSRSPSEAGPSTTEFDDMVVWLSSAVLFSRVCPSGGCP